MIFWFSGTGNSRFVAENLASLLNDRLLPLACAKNHDIAEDTLGIVCPVYSWGIPPIVLDFVASLKMRKAPRFIWAVLTCGDECGLAPEMLMKAFRRRSLTLNAIYSVQMPNDYVILPGFDVDPKDLEKKKLDAAPARIEEIAGKLKAETSADEAFRGPMAWLKTKAVYPLFRRWGIFPKKWRVEDCCISCGQCAAACPVSNITMADGCPKWGTNCTSCLACYHICPRHAVQYARATLRKGQYYHR